MRPAKLSSFLLPAVAATLAAAVLSWAGNASPDGGTHSSKLPWREAGLSERQAAAHLLDRFTFGARPGEVDEVVRVGLDAWLAQQLGHEQPSADLDRRLARLPSLALPLGEMLRLYPDPVLLLREAQQAGAVSEDVDLAGEPGDPDRRAARRDVMRYARDKGYRGQRDLIADLMAQKLYRALYSPNQVREVLADFWYNHFYVSLTDNQARSYVLAYERDAIRPHVLGSFRTLLGATARHPGMLLYLDNARSTANEGEPTTLDGLRQGRFGGGALDGRAGGGRGAGGMGGRRAGRAGFGSGGGFAEPGTMSRSPAGGERAARAGRAGRERPRGLNENYARELLELHTLGVDGGYRQQDVVEVARAFTGWSVMPPPSLLGTEAGGRLARLERAGGLGFVVEGQFLFRAGAHDAGTKTVLGTRLAAGRGIEDGEQVLDLVAAHPSTAKHLARKLAVRFVSDQPPPALVDRLAEVFARDRGDLAAAVRALVGSPEFWAPASRRAKIKSPFELAASALRATGAEVSDPRSTLEWIARMGPPLYLYQAPTGYPDRADQWVSTGALLARMNFGLQLASGRVGGVKLDLPSLSGHEPASRREALATYLALLLPERELSATLAELGPVVDAPDLSRRVTEAAPAEAEGSAAYERLLGGGEMEAMAAGGDSPLGRLYRGQPRASIDTHEPTPLEQVVGVILGSPEFQRR